MLLLDCLAMNSADAQVSYMPLLHSTSVLSLDRILGDRCLNTRPCKLDDAEEELAFLYYGRAAYRASKGQAFRQRGAEPCVLALHHAALESVAHVFPFDSGAFDSYKEGPIHPDSRLSDFDCGKTLDACNAIVVNYWRSVKDYVIFNSETGLRGCHCLGGNMQCAMYVDLLHGVRTPGDVDDRRGSIEVSTGSGVHLKPEHILGVVIPTSAMALPALLSLVEDARRKNHEIKTQTYPYKLRAEEHYGEIVDRVTDMLTLLVPLA
jgi:hypothetical protein